MLIVTVVLLLVVGAFLYASKVNSRNNATSQTTADDASKINLDPPTEQEKQDTEDHKQDIVDKQNNPSPPPPQPGGRTITVAITDAGQYGPEVEVRAYTADVYETGGVCTFTFSKDGTTITKKTDGIKDARTTICTTLTVPRSEFPGEGEWLLEVAYSSSTAQGKAQTRLRIQ